jgi:ABC-2 type transport system ATP-binding protein
MRRLTRTTVEAATAVPADGLGRHPRVHGLEATGTRARFDVDGGHLDGALAPSGTSAASASRRSPGCAGFPT